MKNSIKDGLNSIGDFISTLDEKFIHGMNVLSGKIIKAPYVVAEFLDENKKSISDAIDTTEGYAKYTAYMGTIGRIMEPAIAGSKKISKEAKIMYAKFGKAQFEYKDADKIIAELEKQDIKFTTVGDFIVLENNSGEKIKLKNKELLTSN